MNLFADTTFYSCFLNDVHEPEFLVKCLDSFKCHIGPIVKKELSRSENYYLIEKNPNINYVDYESFNLPKIIAPFLSSEEKAKGEHEVIAYAYHAVQSNEEAILLIDDKGARTIVKCHIPCLIPSLKGTLGFIVDSVKKHKLLNKEKAIIIIKKIDKSNFRISKELVNSSLKNLQDEK